MTTEEKDLKVIRKQWKQFSKTAAYEHLMEFIKTTKETLYIEASGPMYLSVSTKDGNGNVSLDFEPEKYAYLLQRAVGCDIVKTYIDGNVNDISI